MDQVYLGVFLPLIITCTCNPIEGEGQAKEAQEGVVFTTQRIVLMVLLLVLIHIGAFVSFAFYLCLCVHIIINLNYYQ